MQLIYTYPLTIAKEPRAFLNDGVIENAYQAWLSRLRWLMNRTYQMIKREVL